MAARDTGTGAVLEQMVLPALHRGHYACKTQVDIGKRPGGGRHKVDIVAEDDNGRALLVSLKWQQVSGTAEQKVPFETICLADAILDTDNRYHKAYLVLGGAGWKLREYFVGGGLKRYLQHSELVDIVTLEDFIAKANKGQL